MTHASAAAGGDDAHAASPLRWIAAVERGLLVDADPDQLFRILLGALDAREMAGRCNDSGRRQILHELEIRQEAARRTP